MMKPSSPGAYLVAGTFSPLLIIMIAIIIVSKSINLFQTTSGSSVCSSMTSSSLWSFDVSWNNKKGMLAWELPSDCESARHFDSGNISNNSLNSGQSWHAGSGFPATIAACFILRRLCLTILKCDSIQRMLYARIRTNPCSLNFI